jgi:hypothetical protein
MVPDLVLTGEKAMLLVQPLGGEIGAVGGDGHMAEALFMKPAERRQNEPRTHSFSAVPFVNAEQAKLALGVSAEVARSETRGRSGIVGNDKDGARAPFDILLDPRFIITICRSR